MRIAERLILNDNTSEDGGGGDGMVEEKNGMEDGEFQPQLGPVVRLPEKHTGPVLALVIRSTGFY